MEPKRQKEENAAGSGLLRVLSCGQSKESRGL
jgi:hypothetical protein